MNVSQKTFSQASKESVFRSPIEFITLPPSLLLRCVLFPFLFTLNFTICILQVLCIPSCNERKCTQGKINMLEKIQVLGLRTVITESPSFLTFISLF